MSYSVVVLLSLAAAVETVLLVVSEHALSRARQDRLYYHRLSEAILQRANGLTYQAWAYAATGDTAFERRYREAAVVNYERIPVPEPGRAVYQYLVGSDSQALRPGQSALPLTQALAGPGFTGAEVGKLEDVREAWAALESLANAAVNVASGRSDDGSGVHWRGGKPDRELAITLLTGEAYQRRRTAVTKSVAELDTMVDQRTAATLAAHSARTDLLLLVSSCTLLLVVATTLASWGMIRRQVLAPMRDLDTAIALVTAELTTEKAALEAANEQLRRLSQARSDFVSAVSHELRTPLAAITEGVNLVADGSLGPTNERQASFLRLAHRNCIRLGGLVSDLLDLSKIESGRVDLCPERIDIGRAVRDAADAFRGLAEQRGLEFETAVPDAPVYVRADERMVRSILSNLANNALKFTDRGSVSIMVTTDTNSVQVDVKDTGIGIPRSEQPGIFEKFHQISSPKRGRPTGAGLGLALAKYMVEMSSGRIWFESQEGVGTAFHFTLPLDVADGRSGAAS